MVLRGFITKNSNYDWRLLFFGKKFYLKSKCYAEVAVVRCAMYSVVQSMQQ